MSMSYLGRIEHMSIDSKAIDDRHRHEGPCIPNQRKGVLA